MMREILTQSCNGLNRRISVARQSVTTKTFPNEVKLCYDWVIYSLKHLEKEVRRIQHYLERGINEKVLYQTWYIELSGLSNEIEILDLYFIHPLYRLSTDDFIAIKFIAWLHSTHTETVDKPFILSNGNFSIAPSENLPTLYWLPVTSQLSLLHFPLFFHEFGHQLFLLHKAEMEDLIREFQNKLSEYLKPIVSPEDEKYQSYIDKAADIVETWREWMEELFCDAVGFTIGGKTYLLSFSNFIRLGGVKEFYIPERYLSKRSHPVSLLRIRFLAKRAKENELYDEANQLEQEWYSIAETMDLSEDYFGFFEDKFENDIYSLLNDMITETNPMTYTSILKESNAASFNFLELIQEAWSLFYNQPDSYFQWEQEQIAKLLTGE